MSIIEITVGNFINTMESNDLVVAEFFSPTCPHCKRFTPVFTKVSDDFPDLAFGLVNTKEQPDLSKACKIRGLPTVVAFQKGKELNRKLGAVDEEAFREFVSDTINKQQ